MLIYDITHPQKCSIVSLCSSMGPLTVGRLQVPGWPPAYPAPPHTVLLRSLYLPGSLPPVHLHSLGLGIAHLFTQVTPIVSAIRGSRIPSLASPARPRPPTAHTLSSRHPSFLTSVTVTVTHSFICVLCSGCLFSPRDRWCPGSRVWDGKKGKQSKEKSKDDLSWAC